MKSKEELLEMLLTDVSRFNEEMNGDDVDLSELDFTNINSPMEVLNYVK